MNFSNIFEKNIPNFGYFRQKIEDNDENKGLSLGIGSRLSAYFKLEF